jgi:hypothetical protein
VAVRPFVTMEAGNITAQIQAANAAIDRVGAEVIQAAGSALDLLAEDMLAQAQAAAPVDQGRLQESGTTEPLVLEGKDLVKRWGFNLAYARIRDQGGTIRPKKAGGMLAIPLSDVAKKLASPLEQNDLDLVPLNGRLFLVERLAGGGTFEAKHLNAFHWMLVPEVTQQGNGYVTKTVDARRADVPRVVAEHVGKAIGGGA